MNIFVVDYNPIIAAQSLCDAHVCKMIVESCQLLSTQDRLEGLTEGRYKATHVNHPCRRCLDAEANRFWLRVHLMGLLEEYTFRFGRVHKCQEMFDNLWRLYDSKADPTLSRLDRETVIELALYYAGFYSFPECVPPEFDSTELTGTIYYPAIRGVVVAYREYYKYKKRTLKRWKYTRREEPAWLKEE